MASEKEINQHQEIEAVLAEHSGPEKMEQMLRERQAALDAVKDFTPSAPADVCRWCGGRGIVPKEDVGDGPLLKKCPDCLGSGHRPTGGGE